MHSYQPVMWKYVVSVDPPKHSVQADTVPTSNYGYGQNPRCSPMQQQWQTSQPIFAAVKANQTISSYISAQRIPRPLAQQIDFSVVNPTAFHLLPLYPHIPSLADYVQLSLHFWMPDFFMPDLVPFMPCAVSIVDSHGRTAPCPKQTSRRRWRSGGPRVIHDVHSSVYLHTWDYTCPQHGDFSGFSKNSIERLHPIARSRFHYVLTDQEGVTVEVQRMIQSARVSGVSFTALRQQLVNNRFERLYQSIQAYQDHCTHYVHQHQACHRSSQSTSAGQGVDISFECFEPTLDLSNGSCYLDHSPPSTAVFGEIYDRFCHEMMPVWYEHAKQNTAPDVCIDATFKIAKKLRSTAMTRLWSLMDVKTGIILHQQMITHEAHVDVLPMLKQYASRCAELNQPLPRRVCSDRGLMDSKLIHSPSAFPNSHITTDPWHFIQLFVKTLNKSSPLINDVKREFSAALYANAKDPNGKLFNRHAEPAVIIERVNAIISRYSKGGVHLPCITEQTNIWWKAQLSPIGEHRILSNPPNCRDESMQSISSSPLENFHRQLNRVTRSVQFTDTRMHNFLGQFMFQWNVDRARTAGQMFNWNTYDFHRLSSCYQAACSLYGQTKADAIWHGGIKLVKVANVEQFGVFHDHVTFTRQSQSVALLLPISDTLLSTVWAHHSLNNDAKNVRRSIAGFLSNGSGSEEQLSGDVDVKAKDAVNDTSESLAPRDGTFSPPADAYDVSTTGIALPRVAVSQISLVGTPPSIKGAVSVLPHAQLNVLKSLVSMDAVMASALQAGNWQSATSRWNSFAQMSSSQQGSALKLSSLTVESMQQSWNTLVAWKSRVDEQNLLISQEQTKTDYVHVDVKTSPFSAHELAHLEKLAYQSSLASTDGTSKGKANWSNIATRWYHLWMSEKTAGLSEHVLPRLQQTLQSKYDSLKRAKKASQSAQKPITTSEISVSHSEAQIQQGADDEKSVDDAQVGDQLV